MTTNTDLAQAEAEAYDAAVASRDAEDAAAQAEPTIIAHPGVFTLPTSDAIYAGEDVTVTGPDTVGPAADLDDPVVIGQALYDTLEGLPATFTLPGEVLEALLEGPDVVAGAKLAAAETGVKARKGSAKVVGVALADSTDGVVRYVTVP